MMSPPDARIASRRSIAAFYALALGISWSLWAPWIASARAAGSDVSWRHLHLVGSLGPCLAALLVIGWTGGRPRLRALTRGTVTAPAVRSTLIWGIAFPAATFILSALIMARVNGTPARWDRIGLVGEYPGLKRIEYVAASFLFYGIGEEVGWRGFLYPALRRPGRRILTAALLVVPFWALWHLPLFLATESYRAMGLGGAIGWLLSLASGSVLTAWLTDRAKGSVLPAAVLHAVLDVFFLANVAVPVQSALGAIVTVWGVVVAIGQFRHRDG
jgi:membrane protease YdiL (CAAX protease family)